MDSSRLGARRRLRHDATKTERKCADSYLHGGPKKREPQFCQILTDLQFFFTGRFLSKSTVKCILNIPPHLAYVATLPCEILMSAKQAIKDKLQGNVAVYLRCGGII